MSAERMFTVREVSYYSRVSFSFLWYPTVFYTCNFKLMNTCVPFGFRLNISNVYINSTFIFVFPRSFTFYNVLIFSV